MIQSYSIVKLYLGIWKFPPRGKEVGNQKPGEIVVEIVVVVFFLGGEGVGVDIVGSIHLDLLLNFRT